MKTATNLRAISSVDSNNCDLVLELFAKGHAGGDDPASLQLIEATRSLLSHVCKVTLKELVRIYDHCHHRF